MFNDWISSTSSGGPSVNPYGTPVPPTATTTDSDDDVELHVHDSFGLRQAFHTASNLNTTNVVQGSELETPVAEQDYPPCTQQPAPGIPFMGF